MTSSEKKQARDDLTKSRLDQLVRIQQENIQKTADKMVKPTRDFIEKRSKETAFCSLD